MSESNTNGNPGNRRITRALKQHKGRIPKLREIPEHFTPDWLERMDKRYLAVRVLRERFRALAEDQGGLDQLSSAQQTLVKRAVHLEAMLETMEAGIMRGDDVDVNRYTTAINALTNLLRTLGLQKKGRRSAPPKPISKMGGQD